MLGHSISSTQIRKDLSSLGPLGRRGQGYAINPLVEQLAWVLGLEHEWRIAIAGFGYLGHALATFITSRESRFKIAAIFDRSPAVIGQDWQGITVADIVTMEHDIAARRLQHRRHRRPGARCASNRAPHGRRRHSRDFEFRADRAALARTRCWCATSISPANSRCSRIGSPLADAEAQAEARRVMPLVCLGLSHHTAPVEVRERHAFPPSRVVEALVALRDYSPSKKR